MQSQVRLSRVPQNIPEKVPGSRGAKPSQVQRVPGKVAEAKPGEVHLTHGNLAQVFPALGFPACFRKIFKNRMLRLLGIPPKLIVFSMATSSAHFRHWMPSSNATPRGSTSSRMPTSCNGSKRRRQ